MVHAREDYQRFQDPEGKIGEDEPVMLFRAQDRHFVEVLTAYYQILCKDQHVKDDMLDAVSEQIARAEEWQKSHPIKSPDL